MAPNWFELDAVSDPVASFSLCILLSCAHRPEEKRQQNFLSYRAQESSFFSGVAIQVQRMKKEKFISVVLSLRHRPAKNFFPSFSPTKIQISLRRPPDQGHFGVIITTCRSSNTTLHIT